MADVGDCHQQAKSFPARLAVDGIVEVTGGFTIDRYQRELTHVLAASDVFRGHLRAECSRGLLHAGRKFVRQIVLAQRDFYFHARVCVVAENFDHTRNRLGVSRRLRDDFRDDDLARLGIQSVSRRHQEFLADAPVLGDHQHHAALVAQPPDDTMVDVLQHFDDLGLGSAAAIEPDLAHRDAVAVQDLVHFVRPEKHVGAAVVAHDKPEAVRVPLHLAGDQIELADHANRVAPVAHDLAIALHGAKPAFESFALVVGDAKQLFEHGIANRHSLRVQRVQYHFTAWHRLVVVAAFTRMKGIAVAPRSGC